MPNIQKIESEMQRVLSYAMQRDVKNPKLNFVTITAIEVTRDLSFANIYYTVYNSKRIESVQTALDKSKGYLKSIIAKEMKIRKIPELIFKYDESIAYGNKIESLLESLKK